jgi:uncharacterized membrane protein YidH (DUF202 family)
MKKFEDELYDAMCEVFPRTTVRSMSRVMGMSESYWSSICSLGLKVSNMALMRLNEYLEVRVIRLDLENPKILQIKAIQLMIAKEIVSRFVIEVDSIDKVWVEVSSVLASKQEDSPVLCDALPFLMARG